MSTEMDLLKQQLKVLNEAAQHRQVQQLHECLKERERKLHDEERDVRDGLCVQRSQVEMAWQLMKERLCEESAHSSNSTSLPKQPKGYMNYLASRASIPLR